LLRLKILLLLELNWLGQSVRKNWSIMRGSGRTLRQSRKKPMQRRRRRRERRKRLSCRHRQLNQCTCKSQSNLLLSSVIVAMEMVRTCMVMSEWYGAAEDDISYSIAFFLYFRIGGFCTGPILFLSSDIDFIFVLLILVKALLIPV